ncbi:MAG: DUF4336 domain-containing protein [Pseudomonadota bacterium]
MITKLVDGKIWHSTHEVKFGPIKMNTRATFVRLSDGSIWVHSPVPLDELDVAKLARLGEVKFVVAPNKTHHIFFEGFIAQFPGAKGFVAPGLATKEPGLSCFATLDADANRLWSEDFDSVFVDGLPVLNETVWFHRGTGTLLLADLLFSFAPRSFGMTQLVARLLGVYDRLAMSRTMKFMVKDRANFKLSIDQILSWPIERIILAHDRIIEDDAQTQLIAAFGWQH